MGLIDMSVFDFVWMIWSIKICYMGVGVMVVGGLWSFIKFRGLIIRGIKVGFEVVKRR